jgi:hypothetical protein
VSPYAECRRIPVESLRQEEEIAPGDESRSHVLVHGSCFAGDTLQSLTEALPPDAVLGDNDALLVRGNPRPPLDVL